MAGSVYNALTEVLSESYTEEYNEEESLDNIDEMNEEFIEDLLFGGRFDG